MSDSIKTVVGRRITALRTKRGWSKRYLSELIGVEPPSVGRWEDGANLPEADSLETLARLFGVSVTFLFGDGPAVLPAPTAKEALSVLSSLVSAVPSDMVERLVRANADDWSDIRKLLRANDEGMGMLDPAPTQNPKQGRKKA